MKKKRNKKYKVYPIELLYLFIISVVVFLAPVLFNITKDAVFKSNMNMKKIMEVDIDEKTVNKQGFLIKNKLMIQSGENLMCFNTAGEKEWTRPLKSAKTKILKWNDNYIIADLESGRLAVVNSENAVQAEKNLKSKIADITVSKDSLFILMDSENKLIILTEELKQSGIIEHKHGDILKIACDFDSSEIILYTISIQDNEIKTFCIVYDKKGNIIASLDLNKALIFDIYKEDNIVMVSDENFMVYNRIVRPIAEFTYTTSITDSDFKNAKLYVICNASEGDATEKELKVYDSALNQLNLIKVPETTNKVVAGNEYILMASDKRVSVMDKNLKIIQEINLNDDIKEIKWITDDSFYIVENTKLIIYANK